MGKPAARISDMHLCPMVTPGLPPIPHVGGPINGPGCPTVLIGGVPAATVGDMCICVGPPDIIAMGSSGVFIGGKPAARMGDNTAHGGVIVSGCPNVLIGEAAGGGGGGGAGAAGSPGSGNASLYTGNEGLNEQDETSVFDNNPKYSDGTTGIMTQLQIEPLKLALISAASDGKPFCEICQAKKDKLHAEKKALADESKAVMNRNLDKERFLRKLAAENADVFIEMSCEIPENEISAIRDYKIQTATNNLKSEEIESFSKVIKDITDDNNLDLDAEKKEILIDSAQMVLTLTGIFDPTPVSDGLDGLISLSRGDLLGVGISLVSMIPYLGDLSKLGKLPKFAKTIDKAIDIAKVDIKFADKIKPIFKQLKKLLEKIPDGKLPNSAQEIIIKMRKKLDDFFEPVFKGKLRGKIIDLPGIKTNSIRYTKRDDILREALRKEFNNKYRKEFIQNLLDDPAKISKLKEAGLTEIDFIKLRSGKVPKGYQVHHKLPLDDNGTNSFSNLILIKNDPAHSVITNFQRKLTNGLKAGETRIIDFPVPDGFIYPPKAGLLKTP